MQAEMGDRGAMIHFKYEENNSQKKEEQPEVKQEEPSISESAEDQDAFEPRRELKLPPGVEHVSLRAKLLVIILEPNWNSISASISQSELYHRKNCQFRCCQWGTDGNCDQDQTVT